MYILSKLQTADFHNKIQELSEKNESNHIKNIWEKYVSMM